MMAAAGTTVGPIGRSVGQRMTSVSFVVIYDHPVDEDLDRVRIVSVWDPEERGTS